MKIYNLLLLIGFYFFVDNIEIYAQNKTIHERIEEYNNKGEKNETELISIGYALPFFISKRSSDNGQVLWSQEREKVIYNHIEWLDSMYDSGFSIDSPHSSCYSWNVVGAYSTEEEKNTMEEQRIQNEKNCIIYQKHLIYQRVIKRFYSFYNRAFTQEGEGMKELESIIDNIMMEKNTKHKDQIIEAIHFGFKEQEKN